QNIREDKGYTYGAYSYAANAALFGAIVTQTEVRNEVTAATVKEIFYEIDRIVNEPISEEELSLHRQYLAGNYLLSLERASVIAQRVQEIDIYGLEGDYYQKYVTELAGVNSVRGQELAAAHIKPNDLVIAIVGKADEIKEGLMAYGPVTVYDEDFQVIE
ncbi:MAG: insulinase family protein, partial [Verrucomicrobiota bacterium]